MLLASSLPTTHFTNTPHPQPTTSSSYSHYAGSAPQESFVQTPRIRIPDILRNWPWPRRENPHYKVCKAESAEWCRSFKAFSPSAQLAFDRCDFSLLAALSYPLLNKEGCRVGCDLVNFFFVIDEHSDVEDGDGVKQQTAIIMDAIRHPDVPRPVGEWVGGEMARQFWENAIRTATPTSQRRFIAGFQSYLDAVAQQAEDRTCNRIRDVRSYFEVRRRTIGVTPSLAINEMHLDIPDYVIAHPTIQKLTTGCIDMVAVGNDICSYNVEQARGDKHNLVAVVMHEHNLDLDSAIAWVSDLHDTLVDTFLHEYYNAPTWTPPALNEQVREYMYGLVSWVRGNDDWSFEGQRYFGKDGLKVQQTRMVDLLPRHG